MSRSLKIRAACKEKARLALISNGFPTQKALAEQLGLALSTVSNFFNGKPVDIGTFQEICLNLALEWQEIADLRVNPNLSQAQAGEVPENKEGLSSNQEPDETARILLSDRSQDSSCAQQLRQALEAAGKAVFMAEDWLQSSDDELKQYDCFVLLVSSHSEAEKITQEVQRVRQLYDDRLDSKPAILLVHVGSPMCLPLNHRLHSLLQGISQQEWAQSAIATLVGAVQELLAVNLSPVPVVHPEESNTASEWAALLKTLSGFKGEKNWLLTYVGESQIKKLGDLVAELEDQKERRIESRYSYWGLGPVYMWDRACTDKMYHMYENICRFPQYVKQLSNHVNRERYNFVSLGVGEGSKDRSIISDFFNINGGATPREDFLYIPVDMSLDMIRLAIEKCSELPLHCRIAIQRDIESRDGMEKIAFIAKMLGQKRPILYGFIGNTISNVESPQDVLENIIRVMENDDLLLFEAQIVDASALETERLRDTINSVEREYCGEVFRRFAESALLQNTDLSIAPAERNKFYDVDVSLQDWMTGQLLQIDCLFENKSNRPIDMTLLNGQIVRLNSEERIRLYRSRKFTQSTLQSFLEVSGLRIIGKSEYLSDRDTGFMVMMLQRQNCD